MKEKDLNKERTVGETIQYFRKQKNLRQDDLGKLLGIGYPQMSRIETGKVSIHTDRVSEICKALGVDEFEFEKYRLGKENTDEKLKTIPVFGYVNDATQKSSVAYDEKGFPKTAPIGMLGIVSPLSDPLSYGMIVKDESMDPFGRDWTIIISPQYKIQHRDFVVVEYNQSLLFRRIFFEANQQFSLKATHGFEEPLTLNRDEIKIIQKAWTFIAPI